MADNDLRRPLAGVDSTKLTLSAGDEVVLPRIGKIRIQAVLPPTAHRAAWLVMAIEP